MNGDVALATVNGSVIFSTTGGGRASTVNGSIRGEMGRADWSNTLEMTTVNGSITLTLPPDLSTDVKASTVNGDIATDFPMTSPGAISPAQARRHDRRRRPPASPSTASTAVSRSSATERSVAHGARCRQHPMIRSWDGRHHHRVGEDPARLQSLPVDRDHARMPAPLPRLLRLRRRASGRRRHAAPGHRLQRPGTDRSRPRHRRRGEADPRLDRRRRAAGPLPRAERRSCPKLADARHLHPGRDERGPADSRRMGRDPAPADRRLDRRPPAGARRRRTPATYDRIHKHIAGQQITVHCTVTRQQVQRDGYLEEFARLWSANPTRQTDLVQPLHAADRRSVGRDPDAARSRARRRGADGAARGGIPKIRMPEGLHPASTRSRRRARDDCVFAQTTTCVSADFEHRITPCQFGGNPDCSQCGCIASAGLAAVAATGCRAGCGVGAIFDASLRVGRAMRNRREAVA